MITIAELDVVIQTKAAVPVLVVGLPLAVVRPQTDGLQVGLGKPSALKL